MIVTFGVRNCKTRGVLIESIKFGEGNVYFFKYQNQQVDGHCMQMQNIIRSANVKRARKIEVDISEFVHEYLDPIHKTVWFRGVKLESEITQIEKVYKKRLNIEIGVKKRQQSMEVNKKAKEAAKQDALNKKAEAVERMFQEERAKRILALTHAQSQTQHTEMEN